MGKIKIRIEKIEKKEKVQVTFSKRRKGLFRKAAQLCFLCNANVAVVVFSPAGKPYAFGHPSVDAVIDLYGRNRNGSSSISDISSMEAMDNVEHEFKSQHEIKEGQESGFWWERIKLEEIHSLEKLQDLKNELDRAREDVLNQMERLAYLKSSSMNSTTVSWNYGFDGIEMGVRAPFFLLTGHEIGGTSNVNADEQTPTVEDYINDSLVITDVEDLEDAPLDLTGVDYSIFPSEDEIALFLRDDLSPLNP